MAETSNDAMLREAERHAVVDPPRKVVFNPFSPAFRENPYPTYRSLRENAPFLKVLGSWFFSRHSDIVGVLRDRRFSSSRIPELIRRGGRGSRD